jgi:hypothetical protein
MLMWPETRPHRRQEAFRRQLPPAGKQSVAEPAVEKARCKPEGLSTVDRLHNSAAGRFLASWQQTAPVSHPPSPSPARVHDTHCNSCELPHVPKSVVVNLALMPSPAFDASPVVPSMFLRSHNKCKTRTQSCALLITALHETFDTAPQVSLILLHTCWVLLAGKAQLTRSSPIVCSCLSPPSHCLIVLVLASKCAERAAVDECVSTEFSPLASFCCWNVHVEIGFRRPTRL